MLRLGFANFLFDGGLPNSNAANVVKANTVIEGGLGNGGFYSCLRSRNTKGGQLEM